MNKTDILDGLNDSQIKAATTMDGPVLVVAGPGTGKTLTIIRRIAYLIHQGVAPEHILAVTFTNRAAWEMEERATALLGKKYSGVFIGTFHVLGLKIIRDNLQNDFIIYDRHAQISLLKAVAQELRDKGALFTGRISYSKLADRISGIKTGMEAADNETKEIYERYRFALKENSSFDFDDLILQPVSILEHNGLAEKYRSMFRYIIVDEYQDINTAQYRLLRLLTGSRCNICAVGDSDQAIYSFRGADIENFLNFEKDFKDTKRLHLSENYRSTGTILRASGCLIKNNRKRLAKDLSAMKESGNPVMLISATDENTASAAIIKEIELRMGGTSHYTMHSMSERDFSQESYRFSDFAVVYRTNAQARAIEETFISSGIPYQVVGGRTSLQAKATEDTISYMKSLIEQPEEHEGDRTGLIESALLSPADFFDSSADAVSLMTLHMAKGLEFRVVFITGVEDGLIPFTLKEEGIDMEEERRLFYVGMTRAKDELFLINTRNRFIYGQKLAPSPSPFLREIPEECIQAHTIQDKVKKKKEDNQMGLF